VDCGSRTSSRAAGRPGSTGTSKYLHAWKRSGVNPARSVSTTARPGPALLLGNRTTGKALISGAGRFGRQAQLINERGPLSRVGGQRSLLCSPIAVENSPWHSRSTLTCGRIGYLPEADGNPRDLVAHRGFIISNGPDFWVSSFTGRAVEVRGAEPIQLLRRLPH
jgi:hypothetical protein